MDSDQLSKKQINGLEQQVTELLKMMRKAKLNHLPIYRDLQTLEQELGEARRQDFDSNHTEYTGY